MAKLPAWFKSVLEKGKTQVEAAKLGYTRSTCPHWWRQETTWAHAAEPEFRRVMHRRAACILCGEVRVVDTWDGFDPNIPSEYDRDALLEKASVHE
jgi:hypothetical protein